MKKQFTALMLVCMSVLFVSVKMFATDVGKDQSTKGQVFIKTNDLKSEVSNPVEQIMFLVNESVVSVAYAKDVVAQAIKITGQINEASAKGYNYPGDAPNLYWCSTSNKNYFISNALNAFDTKSKYNKTKKSTDQELLGIYLELHNQSLPA